MFGLMFIHHRKTFATYNFFVSQLVGLKPNLRDTQCFGTDGEKALEQALHKSESDQSKARTVMGSGVFVTIRTNLELGSLLAPSLSLHIIITGNKLPEELVAFNSTIVPYESQQIAVW